MEALDYLLWQWEQLNFTLQEDDIIMPLESEKETVKLQDKYNLEWRYQMH